MTPLAQAVVCLLPLVFMVFTAVIAKAEGDQ